MKERTVDHNQKKSPVLAPAKRLDIGEAFLREAHRSREICLLLAKALLRPQPFFPKQPNLPIGELLTMLRLALLAPSDLGHVCASQEYREWYDYLRNLSLWCLSQRLLMPKDVRTAKRVLLAFQPFIPEETIFQANAGLRALEEQYEQRIKLLTSTQPSEEMKIAANAELRRLRQTPRPRRRGGRPVTPGGGRAISEHHQRIVAVALMLKDCGEENPEEVIVSLLREQNVSTKPSKVKRTIATYKAAAGTHLRTDAFIVPENLPESWLEKLGWFYQFWRAINQHVAGIQANGSRQVLLAAFVKDFLKDASFSVKCAPWRSPAALTGRLPTPPLWREGRFDKPCGRKSVDS